MRNIHIIICSDIMKKYYIVSCSVVAIITFSEQEIDDSEQILAKKFKLVVYFHFLVVKIIF
jgi:hypothetical protein